MKFFKQDAAVKRRIPNEVLGVDLGAAGIKVVRLRKGKEHIAVVAADLLPPLDAAAGSLALPPKLITNYAAVVLSGPQHMVRLVTVPGVGEADTALAAKLQEMVKVEAAQRFAFRPLRAVPGKRETMVLTVAMPEAEVHRVLELFPHGPPAALSVEYAGLAALNAFFHGAGNDLYEEAVCFIETGATSTFVAFINKNAPVLIRTMELGGEKLVTNLQTQWGLDRETALGTLGQGATIDISQPLHDLATPFLRQLSISRDFVERQEGCRIGRVYLSGGLSQVKQWGQAIQESMGVATVAWDPFEPLLVPELPEAVSSQGGRFAAAIGAALAVFEET
jgi:Tfp pilus assembly PilM family ATPase